MSNPVAPVVTDEMTQAAVTAYDDECEDFDTETQDALDMHTSAMRAAITAACKALWKHRDEKTDLITAIDAALDWADANARAFTIETAPTDRDVLFWDGFNKEWQEFRMLDLSLLPPSYTHWREPLPPPTNPPLPEPLERLGEVLRRVKGT